jgi:polysaccharide export outer membrane protein
VNETNLIGRLLVAALLAAGCSSLDLGDPDPVGAAGLPRPSLSSEYRLGPEDVVEVFVWKEEDLSTVATVRPDGRITVPLVGELMAGGKTPEELRVEIAESLEKYVNEPTVTVMVKGINSPQISVLGEVRKPGRYRIAQNATVLDAIALGGGFTEYAQPSRVLILRNGGSGVARIAVDVRSMVRHGWPPVAVRPGDTVYVH